MKNYGKVISTVKPESLLFDEKSAWESSDIMETICNDGTILYEYNLIQYGKDEYTKKNIIYQNAVFLEFDALLTEKEG